MRNSPRKEKYPGWDRLDRCSLISDEYLWYLERADAEAPLWVVAAQTPSRLGGTGPKLRIRKGNSNDRGAHTRSAIESISPTTIVYKPDELDI